MVFTGQGGTFSIGPYPESVDQVDQNWKQIDDVRPLLWGYKSSITGIIGDINELFTSCQQWSPQVIAAWNAQDFAPSQIGGANPQGVSLVAACVFRSDPIRRFGGIRSVISVLSGIRTAGGGTGSGSAGGSVTLTITVNASPVNYYVNGSLATPDAGMFNNQNIVTVSDSLVYNQTTYVPIRFAAELLGQPVAWNSSRYGSASPAKSSPLKAIVAVLVLAGLVAGVVLFVRWRRERSYYSTCGRSAR